MSKNRCSKTLKIPVQKAVFFPMEGEIKTHQDQNYSQISVQLSDWSARYNFDSVIQLFNKCLEECQNERSKQMKIPEQKEMIIHSKGERRGTF